MKEKTGRTVFIYLLPRNMFFHVMMYIPYLYFANRIDEYVRDIKEEFLNR